MKKAAAKPLSTLPDTVVLICNDYLLLLFVPVAAFIRESISLWALIFGMALVIMALSSGFVMEEVAAVSSASLAS